jgi:hypothetical protein
MDEENKKSRKGYKAEYVDVVQRLSAAVKRRDPRINAQREKIAAEKVEKEKKKKSEIGKRRLVAEARREEWRAEAEAEAEIRDEEDFLAGRIRIDDLSSDDEIFVSEKGGKGKKQKGKKGKKGKKKNRKRWSSSDEDEDRSEDENGNKKVKKVVATVVSDGEEEAKKPLQDEDTAVKVVENGVEDSKVIAAPTTEDGCCKNGMMEEDKILEAEFASHVISSNDAIDRVDADEDEDVDEISLELELDWRHCEICRKEFKKEPQYQNHIRSKKHLLVLKNIAKTLEAEDNEDSD